MNDLDINTPSLDHIREAHISRNRQQPGKKIEVVKDVLKMLQNAKITPTELLTLVLDTSQPDFAYFHTAFYAEHSVQKFRDLLNLFRNGEKGSATMKDRM